VWSLQKFQNFFQIFSFFPNFFELEINEMFFWEGISFQILMRRRREERDGTAI